MLKKWLLTGVLVVALASLALLAPWWLPRLLDLANSRFGQVGGLVNLVQIVLWIGSAAAFFLGKPRRPGAVLRAPEPLEPLGGLPDLKEAAREYLRYLVEAHRYLELRGMGVSDRVALKLPLLEMYVPLKARLHTPEGETWARELRVAGRRPAKAEAADMGERLSAPLAVLDLLREHDGLVLLGDPGAGKTTFLKFLALTLAGGQGAGIGLGSRLPILLPLAAYANALAAGDVPLDRFIARYYEEERGLQVPLGGLLLQALKEGNVLLLLDGLDEVREEGRRHLVVERVRDFYNRHREAGGGGNRFVLTSRIVGYREVRLAATGLAECTLVDFGDEEIEAFVGKWTVALERAAGGDTAASRGRAAEEKRELLAAVGANPGMQSLAANPLLLTILALMKRQGVALPDRRVELYKIYVETLLKHWNLARGLAGRSGREVDLGETLKVLAPLALWMHEVSPGVGLVKEGKLLRKLEELCAGRGHADPAGAAETFLADVRQSSSLLLSRGEHHYGFIHLTFQEYLAAVALAWRARQDRALLVEELARHVGEAPWHEVVLLTVGHLGTLDHWEEGASEVVMGLLERSPGAPGEAAVWMGEAVADAGPGAVTAACRQKVVDALLAASQATGRVEPVRRAAAGRVLAGVGDPRPGVLTVDGMELCTVAAGPFRMGSEATDAEAFEDERPAHDCDLAYEYRIGRYPVTVSQFREYVQATGEQPRNPESLRGPANHPVVRVSWFEALGFCRWLEDRWRKEGRLVEGWSVSLPSEAEWEKASRGTDGRIYPWGEKFDPERANCRETLIGAVSALGCFPGGASPYGCEEMSGNVWEWTRSENRGYPYLAKDGREDLEASAEVLRVVRGGSFILSSGLARCACRSGREPDIWLVNVGFRVAVLPFSSGL